MVFPHRASADAEALRPFRYMDGPFPDLSLPATLDGHVGQSHGRGDPGQPCHAGITVWDQTPAALSPTKIR
jgi:hypothetical protein